MTSDREWEQRKCGDDGDDCKAVGKKGRREKGRGRRRGGRGGRGQR